MICAVVHLAKLPHVVALTSWGSSPLVIQSKSSHNLKLCWRLSYGLASTDCPIKRVVCVQYAGTNLSLPWTHLTVRNKRHAVFIFLCCQLASILNLQYHPLPFLPAATMAQVSFFDQFSDFQPDNVAVFSVEFNRLANARGWHTGSNTWRRNWARAIHSEFQRAYNTNTSRLANWQDLCAEVGISPMPPSITKCKKVVSCRLPLTWISF